MSMSDVKKLLSYQATEGQDLLREEEPPTDPVGGESVNSNRRLFKLAVLGNVVLLVLLMGSVFRSGNHLSTAPAKEFHRFRFPMTGIAPGVTVGDFYDNPQPGEVYKVGATRNPPEGRVDFSTGNIYGPDGGDPLAYSDGKGKVTDIKSGEEIGYVDEYGIIYKEGHGQIGYVNRYGFVFKGSSVPGQLIGGIVPRFYVPRVYVPDTYNSYISKGLETFDVGAAALVLLF